MKKIVVFILISALLLSLAACGNDTPSASDDSPAPESSVDNTTEEKQAPSGSIDQSSDKDTSAEPPSSTEKKDDPTDDNLADGIRPEFKDAMDSYEAFYDEYCNFMKKYLENPADVELLAEYADMLERLADMDAKFEAWTNEDLTNEETKYYLEVADRVAKKLIDAV